MTCFTFPVCIQVCLHSCFSAPCLWGEELPLFAFCWCLLIGAAVAVRRRARLSCDFLANLLSGRARDASGRPLVGTR